MSVLLPTAPTIAGATTVASGFGQPACQPKYTVGVGWFFWLAFGLYSLNLMVGLAAQLRLAHFGVWHHLLYLGVFVSAAVALLWLQEWFLLITVACLAVFPKARPRTWIHPTLGIVGLVGYILAIVR